MHKTDIQPVLVILICILALLKEKSDALAKKEEEFNILQKELEQTIEVKALLEEKVEILTAKEDECMLLKEKLEKITAALAEKERENERLGEILKSKEEQILSLQNEGNKRKMESAHDSQG